MSNKNTRRQFIKSLALVPLAAVPLPPLVEIEYAPIQPPPYGPSERTAAIDACAKLVDETLVKLERFWGFLRDIRALPPEQVDGEKLLTLENDAHSAMDDLTGTIECSTDFEDVFKWATGKRAYFWCLKSDIIGNERYNFSRAEIQIEIDAFRQDEPAIADELQALLDARYEGRVLSSSKGVL